MNPLQSNRRRCLTAAIALAAGALFAAPAARADILLPHELHRELRAHLHNVLETLVRIPLEIRLDLRNDLDVFLGDSVYYGPHRHYHSIYNFPVWVDGVVYYRPYTYCNDRLYGSYVERPQFWAGWGLEAQGRWCPTHRTYYPVGHGCFHPAPRSYAPRYQPGYDYSHRNYDGRRGYDSRRNYDARRGYDSRRDDHSRREYDSRRDYDSRRGQGSRDRSRGDSGYRNDERSHGGSRSGQGYRSRPGWNEYRSEARPPSRSGHGSQYRSDQRPQSGSRHGTQNRSHDGSKQGSKSSRHDGRDGQKSDGRNRH